MGTTLLIGNPPAPLRSRPGERLLARLLGASLDAALARGCPPESSRLLAARAADLVTPRSRGALAGYWERMLDRAKQEQRAGAWTRRPTAAVPLCADQVVAAEPAIGELVSRLSAALPVPARGVAMARVLLTDATGPLYSRPARDGLPAALEAAIAQLDPARPLLTETFLPNGCS